MKNFLQNLLIFFSLCLCTLIAFQWIRETHLRRDLQALANKVHDQAEAIQSLQGQLKRSEEEVRRLDTLKTELTATIKTNKQEIAQLTKDLEKAQLEIDKNLKQIDVYKEAVAKANATIKQQNENIETQNAEMKKLVAIAAERNELASNYNKVVTDFNDLVKKWNALQEGGKTNAPGKK